MLLRDKCNRARSCDQALQKETSKALVQRHATDLGSLILRVKLLSPFAPRKGVLSIRNLTPTVRVRPFAERKATIDTLNNKCDTALASVDAQAPTSPKLPTCGKRDG